MRIPICQKSSQCHASLLNRSGKAVNRYSFQYFGLLLSSPVVRKLRQPEQRLLWCFRKKSWVCTAHFGQGQGAPSTSDFGAFKGAFLGLAVKICITRVRDPRHSSITKLLPATETSHHEASALARPEVQNFLRLLACAPKYSLCSGVWHGEVSTPPDYAHFYLPASV